MVPHTSEKLKKKGIREDNKNVICRYFKSKTTQRD